MYIILSGISLTTLEGLRSILNTDDDSNIGIVFKIIPLFMSGVTTLIATLIKYFKYQEQLENITRVNEQAIHVIVSLRRLRDSINLITEKEQINKHLEIWPTIYDSYSTIIQNMLPILIPNSSRDILYFKHYNDTENKYNEMDIIFAKKMADIREKDLEFKKKIAISKIREQNMKAIISEEEIHNNEKIINIEKV